MKCPNCNREVVIATDLCPWCGYRYSFDGSPAPKEPVYDPGEEPGRRWRAQRGEDNSDARERWTRAGVYGGEVRREAGRERSGERGMRWHNAVLRWVLYLTGIYYLYRGVSGIMASIGGYSLFMSASTLEIASIVSTCVYGFFGIFAFAARTRLARMERTGVYMYLAVILVPACVNLMYRVMWMTYFEYYFGAFSLTIEFAAAVIYAVLTAVYYSRRRDMFE